MKRRVVTFLMAVSLLAMFSGSAEARSWSLRFSSFTAGTGPTTSGSSFTVIDLLKWWKSGYRGFIKI